MEIGEKGDQCVPVFFLSLARASDSFQIWPRSLYFYSENVFVRLFINIEPAAAVAKSVAKITPYKAG